MVPLICSFLFYQQQSAEHRALEKDYVSCLSITKRHTASQPWNSLFRGGGQDGERLARGAEAACLAARAQPANPQSRRRNWILLARTTAKSVRLTDAGRAFLDNGRALLQNADEAVTKARAVASAEPTELHVGYSPMPTAEILPKTLRAFQRAMPNVHVRLHDLSNKDILDGIRDGRLQLGLIVPPTKAGALHDVRYEELFHERVCVAVARSIRLPGAAPFRLRRLRPNH
jgi:LysR substrate binding domain